MGLYAKATAFSGTGGGSLYWGDAVATFANLPDGREAGEQRLTKDTKIIYLWNGTIWEAQYDPATAAGGLPAHNDTTAKQGGDVGEYYHLTNAELTKLTGIETGATADQSGAEIKSAYEAEADTNAFTDAEKTKLTGIEAGATADMSGAEIKSAYEAEADTNAYTDAEKTKLTGIEAGATADQSDAEIRTAINKERSIPALDIDFSLEQIQVKSITANSTFTFSNLANGTVIWVDITVDATPREVTFPAGIKWNRNDIPLTIPASETWGFVFVRANGVTKAFYHRESAPA